MIALLTKLAERIDAGDIQVLIDKSVPEGAQIEFKESLPARGSGDPDPWMQGDGRIGDRARNEILQEVVAFANAYGGALVLGIAESRSKPPVAANLAPLPRCAELAERLRQVFGACVDPPLPTFDIVSVPMNDDNGVIVFRTGRSSRGPHRVKPTLECPIRRDDRCEALSMREIQDMTLNLARGTERLERRLRERSRKFEEEFKRLETPDDAFGFRMTAVPVGDEIRFGSVYSGGNLIEELSPPEVKVGRGLNNRDSRLRTIRSVAFHALSRLATDAPGSARARRSQLGPVKWEDSLTPKSMQTAYWSGALSRIVYSLLPISLRIRPQCISTPKRRSRRWPGFSFGRTACGSGQRLREWSMSFNRNSKSQLTASMWEATTTELLSGRSNGTIPIFPCILWRLPTKSTRPFPGSRGISGTTLAKIPVGGVGSHWSSLEHNCIGCKN